MKSILASNDSRGKYFLAIMLTILFSLPSMIPYQEGITPICFTLLTLVPLIHTAFITKELDFFDPMVMVSLMYAVGGPLAVLFRDYYNHAETYLLLSNAQSATIWTYRGFACFLLGYFVTQLIIGKRTDNRQNEIPSKYNLVFLKILGFIIIFGLATSMIIYSGVPYAFVESQWSGQEVVLSSFHQSVHYLTQLRYGFFFIYFLMPPALRDKNIKIIFYIILIFHLLFSIGAGAKIHILSLLMCIIISISFSKKKISLKQLYIGVLSTIAIYITFLTITNYRIIVRDIYSYQSELSLASQTKIFFDAMDRSFEKDEDYSTTNIFERLAYITSTVRVFNITRGNPPYENALETLMIPLYAISPRTIFSEKPIFFHSGSLAMLTGWKYGGISVSLIGSLYWSWGYIGIYVGMLFIGIVYAIITINSSYSSFYQSSNRVLMIMLSLALISPDLTFHSVTTDFIRMWVFVYSLSFLITHFNIFNAIRSVGEHAVVKKMEYIDEKN